MALSLYAFPPSPRSFKPIAVIEHLGLPYDLRWVDLSKGEQKSPAYAAININQKAPALEDDGLVIWESNAIVAYLASKDFGSGLLPRDERARADVMRWLFWESSTWDPACAILVFERFVKQAFGAGAPDPAQIAIGLEKFHAAAAILEHHLEGRAFLCGEGVTVADFAIGASMTMAEPAQFPMESYPNLRAWAARLAELPAWSRARARQARPAAA